MRQSVRCAWSPKTDCSGNELWSTEKTHEHFNFRLFSLSARASIVERHCRAPGQNPSVAVLIRSFSCSTRSKTLLPLDGCFSAALTCLTCTSCLPRHPQQLARDAARWFFTFTFIHWLTLASLSVGAQKWTLKRTSRRLALTAVSALCRCRAHWASSQTPTSRS